MLRRTRKFLPALALLLAMLALLAALGFGMARWSPGAGMGADGGDAAPGSAYLRGLEAVGLTISPGDAPAPADFLAGRHDRGGLAAAWFVEEPPFFESGVHPVRIGVEDAHGNRAFFDAELTVLGNSEPPAITGARDIEAMLGTPIMYRSGVSAADAFGRPLALEIDNSAVDAGAPGRYEVLYFAYDAWGNRAEARIWLHILEIEPEYVHARVDEILDGIFFDGMTQVEQARAIFDWVGRNVRFTSDVGYSSAYEAALAALNRRAGNCFVFFGVTHVMLERAGVPAMRIDRVPGSATTNHRWNLINPDGLGWFHMDTTPSGVDIDRFMFTSTQAEEFTELIEARLRRANYFLYDPSLYPEIER